MMRNMNVAMRKEKFGTLNLDKFQQVMKNAELIHVDFIYVLSKKYILYLVLKIMRLIRCSGLMS
jgi:hypothetical protein